MRQELTRIPSDLGGRSVHQCRWPNRCLIYPFDDVLAYQNQVSSGRVFLTGSQLCTVSGEVLPLSVVEDVAPAERIGAVFGYYDGWRSIDWTTLTESDEDTPGGPIDLMDSLVVPYMTSGEMVITKISLPLLEAGTPGNAFPSGTIDHCLHIVIHNAENDLIHHETIPIWQWDAEQGEYISAMSSWETLLDDMSYWSYTLPTPITLDLDNDEYHSHFYVDSGVADWSSSPMIACSSSSPFRPCYAFQIQPTGGQYNTDGIFVVRNLATGLPTDYLAIPVSFATDEICKNWVYGDYIGFDPVTGRVKLPEAMGDVRDYMIECNLVVTLGDINASLISATSRLPEGKTLEDEIESTKTFISDSLHDTRLVVPLTVHSGEIASQSAVAIWRSGHILPAQPDLPSTNLQEDIISSENYRNLVDHYWDVAVSDTALVYTHRIIVSGSIEQVGIVAYGIDQQTGVLSRIGATTIPLPRTDVIPPDEYTGDEVTGYGGARVCHVSGSIFAIMNKWLHTESGIAKCHLNNHRLDVSDMSITLPDWGHINLNRSGVIPHMVSCKDNLVVGVYALQLPPEDMDRNRFMMAAILANDNGFVGDSFIGALWLASGVPGEPGVIDYISYPDENPGDFDKYSSMPERMGLVRTRADHEGNACISCPGGFVVLKIDYNESGMPYLNPWVLDSTHSLNQEESMAYDFAFLASGLIADSFGYIYQWDDDAQTLRRSSNGIGGGINICTERRSVTSIAEEDGTHIFAISGMGTRSVLHYLCSVERAEAGSVNDITCFGVVTGPPVSAGSVSVQHPLKPYHMITVERMHCIDCTSLLPPFGFVEEGGSGELNVVVDGIARVSDMPVGGIYYLGSGEPGQLTTDILNLPFGRVITPSGMLLEFRL